MGLQVFKLGKENPKSSPEEGTWVPFTGLWTDRSQLDLLFEGQAPGTVHGPSILGQELETGESSQNQTQLTAPHQCSKALHPSSL